MGLCLVRPALLCLVLVLASVRNGASTGNGSACSDNRALPVNITACQRCTKGRLCSLVSLTPRHVSGSLALAEMVAVGNHVLSIWGRSYARVEAEAAAACARNERVHLRTAAER